MKKEIYITLILFAFMLFALISTTVRGESVGKNEVQIVNDKTYSRHRISSSILTLTLNRGLQVVNWSSQSLFALLHSRALKVKPPIH